MCRQPKKVENHCSGVKQKTVRHTDFKILFLFFRSKKVFTNITNKPLSKCHFRQMLNLCVLIKLFIKKCSRSLKYCRCKICVCYFASLRKYFLKFFNMKKWNKLTQIKTKQIWAWSMLKHNHLTRALYEYGKKLLWQKLILMHFSRYRFMRQIWNSKIRYNNLVPTQKWGPACIWKAVTY